MKPNWKKQEEKDAKSFGGRLTGGSGNRWNRKGDIKTPRFLVESKSTGRSSYALTLKTWKKIYNEALKSPGNTYRIPLISLYFEREKLPLVILTKSDFMSLAGLEFFI